MSISYKFTKAERLKSRILIDKVFKEGKHLSDKEFRIIFLKHKLPVEYPAQVLISVPKKKFSKAVDRNRIKRLIREVYRLNKHLLYERLQRVDQQIALAFIYQGSKLPEYHEVENKIKELINRLINKLG